MAWMINRMFMEGGKQKKKNSRGQGGLIKMAEMG
ncbi:MAG: hypothetical protein KatS3mg054_0041 [Chloroflexus sp.]|nr:MAG: hypothetical protein KatS3mg054_0041 [Chloroflexus sp.]